MPVERIIGIDFGTSTSVVKVKSYKDNEPLGSLNAVDYVHFDNKDSIPTLIYETVEGKYLIGYEAENAAVKGVLHQNFKLDLIHTDAEKQKRAVKYTEIFFNSLYEAYNEQKSHFPACDIETTYISYPAKWSSELRNVMISIAAGAGFKNVIGLDEPTAAIHTVMVQEKEKLDLSGRDSANLLMIDMGAGTTDLVLCRYTPHSEKRIEILNTWPKDDSHCLFGGREVDEVLCDYVQDYLIDCGLPNTKNFKEKYLDKCKTWKEANLSPILREKDGVVRYCGFIDALLSMLDVDKEFPPLSRHDFENRLSGYISQFPKMVDDCLKDVGFDGALLDYVILTGGHSQWYFTNEILDGTLTRFGNPNLPKIKADSKRIIKLPRPQETVALGLVFQRITITNGIVCKKCGRKNPVYAKFCGYCGNIHGNEKDKGREPHVESEVFCGFCGKKIPARSEFCGYCGKGRKNAEPAKGTTLTITRETQFICAACPYKVIVDGVDYGAVGVGQSKVVSSSSEIVTVEILCTMLMMSQHKVKMKLKLGSNPKIVFKLLYGGSIVPSVHGAEILESK